MSSRRKRGFNVQEEEERTEQKRRRYRDREQLRQCGLHPNSIAAVAQSLRRSTSTFQVQILPVHKFYNFIFKELLKSHREGLGVSSRASYYIPDPFMSLHVGCC